MKGWCALNRVCLHIVYIHIPKENLVAVAVLPFVMCEHVPVAKKYCKVKNKIIV